MRHAVSFWSILSSICYRDGFITEGFVAQNNANNTTMFPFKEFSVFVFIVIKPLKKYRFFYGALPCETFMNAFGTDVLVLFEHK